MTIRHMQIFLEVAETGNMSEAANRLFLSQPTISQAIKDLEVNYGVLLFERRPKKLMLTEYGLALVGHAKEVLHRYEDLEKGMARMKDRGRLRIGSTITVGNSIINGVISDFQKAAPKVDTFVCVHNTATLEHKLLTDDLDIGIIEGEITDRDLMVIPAVADQLVLFCNMRHPFARRRLIALKDLEHQKFHLREAGSGTRRLFENFCKRNNIEINCVFESNCPSAIKRSIIMNDNLSVMSIRLCEDELRAGILHGIIPPGKEWHRRFSLVYHKDKEVTDDMKSMMRIVKSYDANLADDYNFSTLCPKISGECQVEID